MNFEKKLNHLGPNQRKKPACEYVKDDSMFCV